MPCLDYQKLESQTINSIPKDMNNKTFIEVLEKDRESEMIDRSDFQLNDVFLFDWIEVNQIQLFKQKCILISSQSCKSCNLMHYGRFSKHWFDWHSKWFRKFQMISMKMIEWYTLHGLHRWYDISIIHSVWCYWYNFVGKNHIVMDGIEFWLSTIR
jgi:hypothetical protein